MANAVRSLVVWICFLLTWVCVAGTNVTLVHVVFGNHLDVGFAGVDPLVGTDSNVINAYFHEHFPKAIRVARKLRKRGGPERLVYTTHAWLLSLFLDCPHRIGIECPSAEAVSDLEDAIEEGDITWHAFPHNSQVELFDAELLRWAVTSVHALDRKFDQRAKRTMSQRDVPGLTRAAIPILYDAGVRSLSVGVNGGSAPPDVPKNVPFWWEDPQSERQLLSFWHPGGYSGVPVDCRQECMQLEGYHEALCVAWRGDNAGPPGKREVKRVFEMVRQDWPGAEVVASTFDNFTLPLLDALEAPDTKLTIPKITAEIGDTWIHGVGSDPGKVAEFRALLRLRRAAAEVSDDPDFDAFSRLLLKIPEHTWGADTKRALGDWTAWSNAEFQAALARREPNFMAIVHSWVRQRAYNVWAIQELGNAPLGIAAWLALSRLQEGRAVPRPDLRPDEYRRCGLDEPLIFRSPHWEVEIDHVSGGLRSARTFHDDSLGRSSAPRQRTRSTQDSLLSFVYSTYAEDDYSVFWHRYAYLPEPQPWWYIMDFGKPNATALGGARRSDESPKLNAVWVATVHPDYTNRSAPALHVITRSVFSEASVKDAGSPVALWTEIRSWSGSDELEIDVIWENKTATRLPEALWARWRPHRADHKSWLLDKLGSKIGPLGVIQNGSHALHAVGDEGVSVDSSSGNRRLFIRSLDAALVCAGKPNPFPLLDAEPDMKEGMSFALTNNIWGTNYPMWMPYQDSDRNMRFRFVLQEGTADQTSAVLAEE